MFTWHSRFLARSTSAILFGLTLATPAASAEWTFYDEGDGEYFEAFISSDRHSLAVGCDYMFGDVFVDFWTPLQATDAEVEAINNRRPTISFLIDGTELAYSVKAANGSDDRLYFEGLPDEAMFHHPQDAREILVEVTLTDPIEKYVTYRFEIDGGGDAIRETYLECW